MYEILYAQKEHEPAPRSLMGLHLNCPTEIQATSNPSYVWVMEDLLLGLLSLPTLHPLQQDSLVS